jgi:geranylgeranyl diphosphate synthase type II
MNKISQFQELINRAISDRPYTGTPAELYDPLNYMMSLGGKRMRPLLVLIGCELFDGEVQKALPAAIAIEVFHNFSLVHDDIMDRAPLRRGKPTVHTRWNDNVAILSGDVMLVKAYQLLAQTDDHCMRAVQEVFSRTAVEVCEGQQIDMNFEGREEVHMDEYLKMIKYKTAVLLGAGLQIGAIIAGASATDAQKLYDFGTLMGIAFQLQDDYLDVYGDPEKFGKQVGGDIISNKKTYLLIKAMELAGETEKQALDHWLKASPLQPAEKVEAVKAIYDQLGVAELLRAEMNAYSDRAFGVLHSLSLPEEKSCMLSSYLDELAGRQF